MLLSAKAGEQARKIPESAKQIDIAQSVGTRSCPGSPPRRVEARPPSSARSRKSHVCLPPCKEICTIAHILSKTYETKYNLRDHADDLGGVDIPANRTKRPRGTPSPGHGSS